MYILHWAPNTAAFAPQAVLEEAGAPYELRRVDLESGAHRRTDYLALNPAGYVPALITGDGQVLTESAAITLALAERHPEAGLLPEAGSAARADLYRWLFYMTNTIQGAYKRFYYAQRYSIEPGDAGRIKERAIVDLPRRWRVVEEHLAAKGPYVLGDRYSAADIYLVMLATWYWSTDDLLDANPALARCFAMTAERPALRRTFESNGKSWTLGRDPD